jgi:acyl-CoA synthetase (AMP-forming)/AMP-acid ligase II
MLSWIHVLEWRARCSPEVTALSDNRGQELTYRELLAAVEETSARMAAAGIGAGDVVALLARNSADWVVSLFAAVRAGALPAAINWRLATREVTELLTLLEPAAVIAEADTVSLVEEAAPTGTRLSLHTASTPGWRSLAEFEGMVPPRPVPRLRGVEPCLLIHTSGTTGRPKLVPVSHQVLVAAAVFMQLSVPEAVPGARHLTVLPLFHLAGLANVAYCLFTGGRMRILGGFEPARVLDELVDGRIALTNLVPSTIRRLVEEVRARTTPVDLSCLVEISYGASPIDPELLQTASETLGCRFRQHYATTETGCLPVASLPPEDHDPSLGRLASTGVPSLGWEVRITDLAGESLAPGEPGEIQVRGPEGFPGYWNNPQATREVLTDDGFYRTEDVGVFDAAGYLTIVDRLKDMIVSGGENVYPTEVENVLTAHPDVAEAAVIGIPDTRWGETVHAVIVPAAAEIDTEALLGWTRDRLAGFKCPTGFTVTACLPRNATGKIRKAELRAPYWSQRARRVS